MKVCVVIPCYRVAGQVLDVIAGMPDSVARIYVVDDACPEGSGHVVSEQATDPRVRVLVNERNLGVGGAVLRGYRQAIEDGMDIAVKIDGDGQMDPALLPNFIRPIAEGRADYTKGNRFFSPDMARDMPAVRLLGNAVLSFVNKAVSGYWSVMDPTNGYTAIHTRVLREMRLDRIEQRYFFESDMLFQLGLLRAVVRDIPMHARYEDECSSLSVRKTVLEFPGKYANRFLRRFFYNYVLRDFNGGSLQSLCGLALVAGGATFGLYRWIWGSLHDTAATTGTVMLAALPVIVGFQFLIAALQWDMQNQPDQPLHPLLQDHP